MELTKHSLKMAMQEEFLVDYFFVTGLHPDRGLNPFPDLEYNQAAAYDSDEESPFSTGGRAAPDLAPLERSYQPAELCHFPESGGSKSVPEFDPVSVTLMAMPHGMRFRTSLAGEPQLRHFVITREDGTRINGVCLVFSEPVHHPAIRDAFVALERMFTIESGGLLPAAPADALYCEKAVGVLTRQPFLHGLERWLWDLWAFVRDEEEERDLEGLLYNLLFEIPVPPPGASVHFDALYHPRSCIAQRPSDTELPAFEFPLREAMQLLGVENMVRAFTCILLEYRVVLQSRHYRSLTLVAECLTSGLLYPFVWPHVYIPVLPANLVHYLDAPVIYLIGVLSDSPSVCPAPGPGTCLVDIDRKLVTQPEEVAAFPDTAVLLQEVTDILMTSRAAPPRALNMLLPPRGGHDNEVLARVSNLARKSGFTMDDFSSHVNHAWLHAAASLSSADYREMLLVNNAIREVFLNHFVHILNNYELFVVKPKSLALMDPVQSFDKTAFLSDQSKSYLTFLSPFLETQMFTNFIDFKIISTFEVRQPRPSLFDSRVHHSQSASNSHTTSNTGATNGRVQTPGAFPSDIYSRAYRRLNVGSKFPTDQLVEKRIMQPSITALSPHKLEGKEDAADDESGGVKRRGEFPRLRAAHLRVRPINSAGAERRNEHKDSLARHKRRERFLQIDTHYPTHEPARNLLRLSDVGRVEKVGLRRQSQAGDTMPLTNFNIIDSLLNDVKTKTKRMVVEKMGNEAFLLGHSCLSLSGVEENTLIAGLCDLLDRIWSHGAMARKSKSALWHHLVRFYELKTGRAPPGPCSDDGQRYDARGSKSAATTPTTPTVSRHVRRKSMTSSSPTNFTTDITATSIRSKVQSMFRRDLNSSLKRCVKGGRHVSPLDAFSGDPALEENIGTAEKLLADIRSIRRMEDIHSELGYGRAFVRLSLEKKQLSSHLKLLLCGSDVSDQLLHELYKTWAFLRSADEREQLLFHLLSLNAVDYFAFTNTFNKTRILYRVLIYTGKRFGGQNTSANAWLQISGYHGKTGRMAIPHGQTCVEFEHANLGCLTTLHLGHDNSGISPKWYVESVFIQNTVTGHIYRFPCERWLGRDVDDGSLERMLIAQLLQSPQTPAGSGRESRSTLGASGGSHSSSGGGISDWTLGRRRTLTSGSGIGAAALLAAAGNQTGLLGVEKSRRSGSGYASMPSSPTASLRRRSRQASVERDAASIHSSFSASGHHLAASSASDIHIAELQESLREAVNRLIKHLCKPEHEQGNLTVLLCDTAEAGLLPTLERVLAHGFRASRGLFTRTLYVWDYLERVAKSFEDDWETLRRHLDAGQFALATRFTRYISLVNQKANPGLGKDRKFQIWLCIGLRDHLLQHWLPLMVKEAFVLTRQYYDELSFLRDNDLRTFVCDVLASLDSYSIYLEPVLVGNIDS